MNPDLTQILNAIDRGDRHSSGRLLQLVYDELRSLAAHKMSGESADHTLQPTALVHEAFLRLVGNEDIEQWENRGHFFMAAAEAMHRILIEHARKKKALKRGGAIAQYELEEHDASIDPIDYESLLALDEALCRLAKIDEQLVQLVKLRYFTGLTIEDTARILNISPRTTKRNWAYARAWLRREIEGEEDNSGES